MQIQAPFDLARFNLRACRRAALALLALFAPALPCQAAKPEPWADPNLKVVDGLADANDYTTGLTIDQSWAATPDFSAVNIEGAGFGGAVNLKTDRAPLLRVARLCGGSSVGKEGTALFVNARAAGKRDRARTRGETLVVGDTERRETIVERASVQESRPSTASIMPLRGIAWTAVEPVDRFNALVTGGARLQSPPTSEPAADVPTPAAPAKTPAAEKDTDKPSAPRKAEKATIAKQGMVVTVSPPASDVGLAILERGGNAVDSAIATAFALSVTFPEAGNIGGGGFMMVWPGEGKEPVCIDYRETAPAAAGRETFVHESDLHSPKTVGVPGTVRGLALAHQKFGKLPWRDLVAPAAELAERGFILDDVVARGINGIAAKETTGAEFRRVYGRADGRRWRAGDRLTLPDLGRTLRKIAAEGPDSFYKGAIAEQIVAEMKAGGGLIAAADLAGYQAIAREPIHGTYRGFDIYGPPPPSSGGILIVEMLNILENFDLKSEPRWSPRNTHLVIEAMRRGFCDRARHIGDPAHAAVPGHLTSKEYAAKLAKSIDPDRATRSDKLAPEIQLAEKGESTTHFSIVDRNRMAVANTYTLQDSWGSRIVVGGGGFLLNNEMTDFNWRPGHTDRKGTIGTDANLVAPGKRMLSSQTPTLVARDGKLLLVTGSPGGRTIPNTTLCVLLGVLDFDLDARAAVDAPRIHQQWLPDRAPFEGTADPQFATLLEKLRAMGHRIPEKASVQGDAHTIRVSGETLEGAADSRRTVGKAAGY